MEDLSREAISKKPGQILNVERLVIPVVALSVSSGKTRQRRFCRDNGSPFSFSFSFSNPTNRKNAPGATAN
jgi:hypothetical protein